ncbi:MAG: pyridoxamine 5'-phosphate oxidase family protein, partial [Anaerolineales bacterium]|nr:pyridoxamine 5'-phosphate oxidase family protein [Anaerolineales bacterium]
MSAPVTEKSLAYLRGHNVMTLATAGEDGPWAAAVFYVNEGFTLNFLSAPTTRHAANIAANPQVAATVQEDYHDWREIKGVQLDGAAVMLSRTESATASARFAAK